MNNKKKHKIILKKMFIITNIPIVNKITVSILKEE